MQFTLSTISLINELQLPFLLLYAETHFRFFSLFPSLLFKRQPEVVFDLPYRIEPDEDLPIALLINDVVRFPDVPVSVAIAVSQHGSKPQLFTFSEVTNFEISHVFQKNQRVFLFNLPKKQLPEGEFFVTATVTMCSSKKSYTVINDNFNTSSKRAFRCFKSSFSLPGNGLCAYGDLHVHSSYSQSHVEFGPPVRVIDRMAKSCGLSFAGITDHSYDLSCEIDNYLQEDQALNRWKRLDEELSDSVNYSTLLLLGEEVSCLNSFGKTVHLGALSIREFIPGSSDGARRNLHFKQSLTVSQAVEEIHRQGGTAIAAHPGSRCGFLQRFFLNRGQWSSTDLECSIDGMQAFNNGFSATWSRAKSLWIEILQQKNHIPLLAGNDAHGDFNRYRAIKTPFLSIYEDYQRFMGFGRTGIYGTINTGADIINGIKNNATFITTGPYLSINYTDTPGNVAVGATLSENERKSLFVHAVSTSEFGTLTTLSVYCYSGSGKEQLLWSTRYTSPLFNAMLPIDVTKLVPGGYIRAEATSRRNDGTEFQAYTSACFT